MIKRTMDGKELQRLACPGALDPDVYKKRSFE